MGGRDALFLRVARAIGVTPRKGEDLLWGPRNIANICADIYRAMTDPRDAEARERFIAPVRAALADEPIVADNPEVHLVEQRADGLEDEAQLAYKMCPNRATAEQFIRRSRAACVALQRASAAVAARWNLS